MKVDIVREINLRSGIVRQNIGEMKTEASKKPIPLDAELPAVVMGWRSCCACSQQEWIFSSPDIQGGQPHWPNSAMEKHVRPAARRAGVSKRIGWHLFRQSYATLLKANGEDVKTVRESLRHDSSKTSFDVYTQAVTSVKREAQRKIVAMIQPIVALRSHAVV